jgi:hypothetical protein
MMMPTKGGEKPDELGIGEIIENREKGHHPGGKRRDEIQVPQGEAPVFGLEKLPGKIRQLRRLGRRNGSGRYG